MNYVKKMKVKTMKSIEQQSIMAPKLRMRHDKMNFFCVYILVAVIVSFSSVSSQLINSPPILHLPDRNWQIFENERVGQTIARVRAEDAEGDVLKFGLEPAFLHGIHNGPSFNYNRTSLPFSIDKDFGIVTLNESLLGKGGEILPLYVTVTDGQFSAKIEVLVNILSANKQNKPNQPYKPELPPTFLPPFKNLPGVPSFGNRDSYNNWKTPPQVLKPSERFTTPVSEYATKEEVTPTTPTPKDINIVNSLDISKNDTTLSMNVTSTDNSKDDSNWIGSSNIEATLMLGIFSFGIFCALAAIIIGYIYRKRVLRYKENPIKSSKEILSKLSHQRSDSGDDGRNSMVLQNWNGPQAYGNRYVPWEVDQTLQQNETTRIQTDHGSEVNENNINVTNNKTFDSWEFPRHRLKFFNILGEGAFGQVWKCEATGIAGNDDVTTVAVKTLKENASEVEKKDLLSELEVMKSLEPHVNVVRLLGCCTEKDPVFVVLEYVNRGKLQTFLRQSRADRHYGNTQGESKYLTSADLTSFMYQVAKGMDFLTAKGIIHRDLAARNILINKDNTCKVADFGFARDVVSSKIYERKSEGKLPIRWMAIESLYDNIFSVKSDIWSFGILMWEIVTLGSTPYPGISAGEVMRKVRDGYRLEKPEHCRRELYNIMYYCWSKDPRERPLFSELVEMLDKLLHTEKDYIELERFPDHNYYNILSLSDEKV